MLVIPKHELLKGRWGEHSFGTSIFKSLPSHRDGCINVNQNEEWTVCQCFNDTFIVNGGGHVVVLPVLGDEIYESGHR